MSWVLLGPGRRSGALLGPGTRSGDLLGPGSRSWVRLGPGTRSGALLGVWGLGFGVVFCGKLWRPVMVLIRV